MDRKDKIKKRLQKKVVDKENKKESKKEEINPINTEDKTSQIPLKKTNESFDNLKIFQAINDFVGDITSICGEKLLELETYNKLLSATTLKNKTAIENHVKIFREYCKNNKDTILNKTEKEVKNINYSEVLFIDLVQIFKMVDDENKISIWKHL